MTLEVPESFLAFAARGTDWERWLDALPRLARDVLSEWRLVADGAVLHGECAIVIPVLTSAGEEAVLKVGWPHEEAQQEHLALRQWNGHGAVRLLRADPRRFALLLERVDHTTDLTAVPIDEACAAIADLYGRLHVPANARFRPLSEVAAQWSRDLSALPLNAPVPRRFVDQAAALAAGLADDQGTDGRLLHGDLHYFNVLATEREPWLAIDPKPLSGDPAFEVAPLLFNRWEEMLDAPDLRSAIRHRFHAVVDAAGLDESRARDWVIVRMLVNIQWQLADFDGDVTPYDAMPDDVVQWITDCITITKAVQD